MMLHTCILQIKKYNMGIVKRVEKMVRVRKMEKIERIREAKKTIREIN